jgi:hypothetical protein
VREASFTTFTSKNRLDKIRQEVGSTILSSLSPPVSVSVLLYGYGALCFCLCLALPSLPVCCNRPRPRMRLLALSTRRDQ